MPINAAASVFKYGTVKCYLLDGMLIPLHAFTADVIGFGQALRATGFRGFFFSTHKQAINLNY